MKSTFSLTLLASLIAGCGGGGGAGIAKVNGKILDGYISNATVFWDCNLNGKLDAGEVSTISIAGGSYAIDPAPRSGCRLTAYIPATAIDEDTGTAVLTPYTMMALDANQAIISPLTTLAVLNTSSNQTVAVADLKAAFSINLAIDGDYIATQSQDGIFARKVAKVTAQLLQANHSPQYVYSSSAFKNVSTSLSTLVSSINGASLSDVVRKIILIPSDLLHPFVNFFYIDSALGIRVNSTGRASDQVAYLSTLISDPRVTPHIGSGQIAWEQVDLAALGDINSKLNQLGFTSDRTAQLTLEYSNKRDAISAKFAPLIQDSNSVITLDGESIGALFDIADAAIKGGYGVAKMAAVAPNVTGVFNNLAMTPGAQGKFIRNIDKLSKYTDFEKKLADCGTPLSDFRTTFDGSDISPDKYLSALKNVGALVGCLGSFIDEQPVGQGISYFVGLFKAGAADESEAIEAAATLFETLNLVIGLAPPTPFTNFVSGFLDVMGAAVDSYKAGVTIGVQAGKKFDLLAADLDAQQNVQLAIVKREYLAQRVRALLGYSIVRADWTTFVGPITATNFSDDFSGASLDAKKWVVESLGGNVASLTWQGSYLEINVPGGSCGYCGISDGSRFTPQTDSLAGDFVMELSAEEIARASRDSSQPISNIQLLLLGATTQAGIYVTGDVNNNQGNPGHTIYAYYINGGAATYPIVKSLTIGQYYALKFRIRRAGGVLYLGYMIPQDTTWNEVTVPASFPSTGVYTPSIVVASGDGGGTRVNSSFKARFHYFTISR